ncbi:MAG: segregation/condensation protein A [Candidatus Ancaeobacter aquaticus]|nr:segregation/condensation protein A [Candidatus Ancaeobacter aquaticus]
MNTENTGSYKVDLEVFEGPLDLLLYLIKKDEIDIYDIPIEKITDQYLEYMELLKMLDIDIAGEFLVMAATLMYIKSRTLLPVEDQLPLEEDEEDPRFELVKQLLEYKKFKEFAEQLRDKEHEQANVFARSLGKEVVVEEEGAEKPPLDVNIFDLITAFSDVLNRADEISLTKMFDDKFTVEDKRAHLIDRLQSENKIKFNDLFTNLTTRPEIIVTFLALLELIRLKQARAIQDEAFGELVIARVEQE